MRLGKALAPAALFQQPYEIFHGQSCSADEVAEGTTVKLLVVGNREMSSYPGLRENHVTATPATELPTRILERGSRQLATENREHRLNGDGNDFDLSARQSGVGAILRHLKPTFDCLFDVGQRLLASLALGNAPAKSRHMRNDPSVLSRLEHNFEGHSHIMEEMLG